MVKDYNDCIKIWDAYDASMMALAMSAHPAREASKNELLGKAVEDAKAKAVVLSKAAGVKLKQIQSIDYSWGEIDFECSPISEHFRNQSMMMCKESGSYDVNVEPDDIEVSDTVTVTWEIG